MTPKVLIVVDVQNDFCLNGALPVFGGEEVARPISQLAAKYRNVILTQDWHPEGHLSFASAWGRQPFEKQEMYYGLQTMWPDHCIQNSFGASIHDALDVPHARAIVRKGMDPKVDSYSAFKDAAGRTTGLDGYLRDARLCIELDIVGLALDVCVAATAADARRMGYITRVLCDYCRPIGPPAEVGLMLDNLRKQGVQIV